MGESGAHNTKSYKNVENTLEIGWDTRYVKSGGANERPLQKACQLIGMKIKHISNCLLIPTQFYTLNDRDFFSWVVFVVWPLAIHFHWSTHLE